MSTVTKAELLLGGPGLTGYAYRADMYCVDCAHGIIRAGPKELDELEARDSEVTPQPEFFGESEEDTYCGQCGVFMYGGYMCGCGRGPKEEQYDHYNIYFGAMCDDCFKEKCKQGPYFDPLYAGERLEEEER